MSDRRTSWSQMQQGPKKRWFDEDAFRDWFFTMIIPKLKKQEQKMILIRYHL